LGRRRAAAVDVAAHGLRSGGGGGREGAAAPAATEDEEEDRQREEETDQHQLRPHAGAAPPGSPLLVVVAVGRSPRAPRSLHVHIRIPTNSSIPFCTSSPLVLTRLFACAGFSPPRLRWRLCALPCLEPVNPLEATGTLNRWREGDDDVRPDRTYTGRTVLLLVSATPAYSIVVSPSLEST
jgi:hypothetical protein